ncbi:hypothetical protein BSKO_11262 [Bryopsis sp. KO-2023]|nr:hypothetical protein BSKO_11262 [Bryopsis sp. KO-2023]
MNQRRAASFALFLLAGMACLVEGVPKSRVHHIAQFRKLNALISSDASTSQSFGDVIFENPAQAPEGEMEAAASPQPSTEEGILSPAISPEDPLEESPAESPQEIVSEPPAEAPSESPEDAPEESPAESPEDTVSGPPAEAPAEVPESSLVAPDEAPAESPDALESLEKDLPDLFPASAPDVEIDLDELTRQQLLNTSRNFVESELENENAAGRESGAVLGTLIAFALTWAVLP